MPTMWPLLMSKLHFRMLLRSADSWPPNRLPTLMHCSHCTYAIAIIQHNAAHHSIAAVVATTAMMFAVVAELFSGEKTSFQSRCEKERKKSRKEKSN